MNNESIKGHVFAIIAIVAIYIDIDIVSCGKIGLYRAN